MKLPNAWGLFDMHGNFLEWCYDWYGAHATIGFKFIEDPIGPDSPGEFVSRVLRGGAFSSGSSYARSAKGSNDYPSNRGDIAGFRPARTYP